MRMLPSRPADATTEDAVLGSMCDRVGSKKTVVLMDEVWPFMVASKRGSGPSSAWILVVWSPDAVN
jgi:hypothetical protein